jgi:hypothetical protein
MKPEVLYAVLIALYRGTILTRSLKFFLLSLLACASAGLCAQGRANTSSSADGPAIDVIAGPEISSLPDGSAAAVSDPVAHARDARPWHWGPFLNVGRGAGDRDQYYFVWAGAELGKALTPVLDLGPLSGQFELAGNIQPLWQAWTPDPHLQLYKCQAPDGSTVPCELPVGGGHYTGFAMMPVIMRWNFLTRSHHWQPWFQGAGGLIYTTHKFPPDVLVTHGMPGGTSVWNFTPQGGIGVRYFTSSKGSIDLGLNAVHISSASLGDRNPGVNASLQVQIGYTFWK